MNGHALLLLAEASVAGGLVLLLFWLRRTLGLAPLYLAIGAFQYLQVVLASSVIVEVAPGLAVNPGSSVLFPLTVFVVLLTYIEQDADETRKVAYGVVIANLALFFVSTIAGRHLGLDGHRNPLGLPVELLAQNGRVIAAGTFALFVDVVSAIVIFEQVSRWFTRSLFLRLWTTSVAVMAIDSALFTAGVFLGADDAFGILSTLFLGKAVSATFYSALVAAYARLIEAPGRRQATDPSVRDVFQWLTYRQRYEQARLQMTRDALTGLFNRGYFDDTAPRHIAHANRAGHEMSLVMIDVDRLKDANDRHGHQAGDALLTFVSRQVEQMVRSSDVACRYGGDEFVVILTTANARAAQIFSERLRDLVQTMSAAETPVPPWAPASVTIGIATYPADGTTLADLMLRADERLYAGKRLGGARVTGAASGPEDTS